MLKRDPPTAMKLAIWGPYKLRWEKVELALLASRHGQLLMAVGKEDELFRDVAMNI